MIDEMDITVTEKEGVMSTSDNKKLIQGIIIGFLFAMLLALLALIGRRAYDAYAVKSEIKKASVRDTEAVVNDEVVRKLSLIQTVIDKYYLDEYTTESLRDGLYDGIVDSLGDKYAGYYSPEELLKLKEDSEGIYYGIGAYIAWDDELGYCIIAGVMDGTPAEEAGLMANDIIAMVDGVSTQGVKSSDIVKLIKGDEGTIVHMTIVRGEKKEALEIDVERRRVESPTVTQKMLDDNIGYIQIAEFDAVTATQFEEALATCYESGARGLVIDLRGNLGGNLDAVVEMCRQILPEGKIVYTRDKNGEGEVYECDGSKELEIPLAVLVNGYSASASEIMTGAVKDYGIGTIIGTTTFGKGIVQKVISLSDGSAMKLTVSKYYTPNGTCIHGKGIEPDIEVPFDGEAYTKDGSDNQLDAAIAEIHRKWESSEN